MEGLEWYKLGYLRIKTMSPLYSSIFYGGGNLGGFYGTGNTDVPQDLRFYRTNVDGVYVFHWGFDAGFITPLLATADFDLELDTVSTFDSLNLTQFTSLTALNFQNGDARKGFDVPVASRIDKQEQVWYARVRTRIGFNVSAWSSVLQFIIPERFEVESSENIVNALPDFHVYGKEDLLKPVVDRNSNLYTVATMYGKEVDRTLLENLLTTTNNYVNLCRDEQLYNNFGVLFNYRKPQTQEFVEYRMCLLDLILAALVGGTIDAIQRVVRCFTGIDPVIELIRDRNDFFLSTIFQTPPETTDGIITHFSTYDDTFTINSFSITTVTDATHLQVSSTTGIHNGDTINQGSTETEVLSVIDTTNLLVESTTGFIAGTVISFTAINYIVGSLIVLQNGVILTSGVDYTENHATPGFDMTVAPSPGDVLQVFFEIGFASDPEPLIFDIDDTTPLTGAVTFTNGSTIVTGAGTLFTTELVSGNTITDSEGLILGVVDIITDDFNLTLTDDWIGDSGSGTAAKLNFGEDELPPSIAWDQTSLAFGVVIHVLNPGNFALNEELIKTLVTPLVPAHVKIFYLFD
jgi:hypothetical protein